jgi:putative ABC transport system substrate-binding protein
MFRRTVLPMKKTLLAALLVLLVQPLWAEDAVSGWFNLSPATGRYWELLSMPADEDVLYISPKGAFGVGEGRTILVLFPKASSAYDTAMNTILGVFYDNRVQAEFTLVNFHNDRDRGSEALDVAESKNCDLVFSMGSQSTQFIFQNYSGGRIPVVSVCSKDPVLQGQIEDYKGGSGTNMAFTSLDAPVDLQLTYLLRLKKGLRNMAIVYARDNVSAVETQVKPMAVLAEKQGIQVLHVVVEDQDKAGQELSRDIPRAVEQMRVSDAQQRDSVFWITGSTSVFQEIETIDRFAGRIPVLSVVPDIVTGAEASAVLSIGVSFENNALKAALYALAILNRNVYPGDLDVGLVSPPDLAINFRKAREIGLTVPFSFFESASTVFDYRGRAVRYKGERVLSD